MPTDARKVLVVTGSRADWGLLRWIVDGLHRSTAVELQLVATGSHLAEKFGDTIKPVEDSGLPIAARVQTLSEDDSPVGIARAIASGVEGFAEVVRQLGPDLLLILGDRYEVFAAAQAAMCANVPIAHIAGGDSTEGAIDEAIRHSLTKMSHLHFVTNDDAYRRVCQLGENPEHVFAVGSPGVDYILRSDLLSRPELEASLGHRFRARNVLVTFHPVTLSHDEGIAQLDSLLVALDELGEDVALFLTLANADTFGSALRERVMQFVAGRPNAAAFASLGQERYLSLLAAVDVVVGNSSSGLYEAPTLRTATVNIGDRQHGRIKAASVIDAAGDKESIARALEQALSLDITEVVNPYGSGGAVERIVDVIEGFGDFRPLLKKRFHDLEVLR